MRLPEIADLCIYFTENPIYELSLVSKYWNENVKKIRITSNKSYPGMKDEHLSQLPNLTELDLSTSYKKSMQRMLQSFHRSGFRKDNITDQGIADLINLKTLNLSSNHSITNQGISKLTNLTSLDVSYNHSITEQGISGLTNLTSLDFCFNYGILINEMSHLTNLRTINLNFYSSKSEHIQNLFPKCKVTFNNSEYFPLQ